MRSLTTIQIEAKRRRLDRLQQRINESEIKLRDLKQQFYRIERELSAANDARMNLDYNRYNQRKSE